MLKNILVISVAAAPFGPYITSGLRTEQIAIYAVAILALATRSSSFPSKLKPFAFLWLLLGLVCAVASISSTEPISPIRFLASLDNHVIVLASIMATSYVLQDKQTESGRKRPYFMLHCLSLMLAANAVVAIFQSIGMFESWIAPFLPSGNERGSVSERAAAGNRYGGVFNQPVEAGTAYATGLIASTFLYTRKQIPLLTFGAITLMIIIGGILSGSKAFIPLGVILWAAYVQLPGMRINRLGPAIIAIGALTAAIAMHTGLYSEGSRLYMYLSPASTDRTLVQLYTAGRFSEGLASERLIHGAMESISDSPLIGNGFGAGNTAIDIGILQALYQGGLIGTSLMILSCAALLRASYNTNTPHCQKFLLAITVLILVVFTGAPSLTLNRCGTVFWISITSGMAIGISEPTAARQSHMKRTAIPIARRQRASEF